MTDGDASGATSADTLERMADALSPRWRGLRAGVFAVVAALLAAAGHAVGGGEFPDAAALLSTTTVLGGTVTGLARRRRTAGGIFAVLLASQVAFHLVFTVTEHQHHALDLARMTAFHVVAAGLAALVLARGESALFALLSFLGRVAPTLPGGAPQPAVPGRVRRRFDAGTPVIRGVDLRSISRRGPPLVV